MIIELDNITSRLLSLSLDASVLKQEVIANNIANINSVGFVPKTVTFESYLQEEIELNNSGSAQLSDMQVDNIEYMLKSGDFVEEANADKVELDTEMVKLTQNVIHYQTLLQAMKGRVAVIKMAVNEGR